MDLCSSIEQLLNSCILALIDNKDDLELDVMQEESAEGNTVVVANIKVNKEDVGKIIGKQGRTIKSLRTLARALGAKHDSRVEVEIIEED